MAEGGERKSVSILIWPYMLTGRKALKNQPAPKWDIYNKKIHIKLKLYRLSITTGLWYFKYTWVHWTSRLAITFWHSCLGFWMALVKFFFQQLILIVLSLDKQHIILLYITPTAIQICLVMSAFWGQAYIRWLITGSFNCWWLLFLILLFLVQS